ncbi:hypothetical protein WR25_24576 isoform C [Diploscapter pachys]|uniref:sphinganine-1-phosphate aldolase n=1 Tax=Diploscapter pachys TaxID=2018661 RepID=A0A2A2LZT8_9BILA|nr:hypothetical protein WR25_24576 isoform A [Diploscapter pachys]PAV91537.1 hypothetical protein WR25_24576 isoform C [Diploscapter pachys]
MNSAYLYNIVDEINDELKQVNPLVLAALCVSSTYLACQLWNMHRDDIGIRRRVKNYVFNFIKSIPMVRKQIDTQLKEVKDELVKSLVYKDGPNEFITKLPEQGINPDELINLARVYDRMEGPRYLEGRVSGAVFSDESNTDEMTVYQEVFRRFAWSNPLWPKLFPGVRKMESEVIRMCCNLMNGDEESCGTMSTGGTMSIMLACLAHRNRALKRGVQFPEMVIPSTCHAAFTKAAEVFRIKAVKVPVNPQTYKVDLKKMRSAISSRTCMLVGSAPNFPYGTVDDIAAIGEIGVKYDIPVHVDACLGGFLLSFLETDYQWDFRVPGVASISADTHKYGLTPKGSSVVLYKNASYLHNQYFCDPDWQGGIYASSTLEGSRAGVNIALCWASLLFQGQDNYRRYAEDIVATTKKIREGYGICIL